MSLRLKNTYTKTLERFAPLDPQGRDVKMYTCGPTVYSFAHIGNFRSFLFADLLRRVLERRGHRVHQVMNITDVGHMTEDHLADAGGEDKLAVAARKLGADPYKVAEHFASAFAEDAVAMRLRVYLGEEATDPAVHPRATQYVPEMLAMIQRLLERGFAYVDGTGQVYFEVAKFPEYGRLSGKNLDELELGARIAVRDEKRDPRDFALWKVDPKHLMQWDPHAPEGWADDGFARLQRLVPSGVDPRVQKGFPGWHIECSAMARALLGDCIDVHTGGEDNIFPHHECEIAQSFGAFGTMVTSPPDGASEERKTFARFWVHGRHLLVDGRKMSKRDGTFFTVRDLLDPAREGRPDLAQSLETLGFPGGRVSAPVLRYALTATPYTQPMNFTFDSLVQARASVERLQTCFDRLREAAGVEPKAGEAPVDVEALARPHVEELDEALDDNLNTSRALAAIFGFVTAVNQAAPTGAAATRALEVLVGFDAIFDVLDRRVRSGLVTKASLDARAAGLDGSAAVLALPEGVLDMDAIEQALALRQAAKRAKNFRGADGLREELRQRGVLVEDTPQGVRWKLAD